MIINIQCISMIFLNKIQTPSSLHIPESYGFARKDGWIGWVGNMKKATSRSREYACMHRQQGQKLSNHDFRQHHAR